jgi:hypothetical protein
VKFSGWSEFNPPILSADLEQTGERSGLHLSQIIHEMKVGMGEKVGPLAMDTQPDLRHIEGFLFETALEYVAAGMPLDQAMDLSFKRYMMKVREGIATQMHIEKDGIKMTPDGLVEAEGIAESYKMTRRTFRKAKTQTMFEQNYWAWLVQEKSYCWAMGVDQARWIVLFQAGDYGKGVGSAPICMQCEVTFTVDELKENWDNVLRVAERLRNEKCEVGNLH